MPIYSINGSELAGAYDVAGDSLDSVYDVNGNLLMDSYIAGRLLVFEENFTSNALNTDVWECEVGHPRGKSYEAKWPGNISIRNGMLVSAAIRENREMYSESTGQQKTYTWTEGTVFTRGRKQWVYGRFEAKMKLPPYFNGSFWFAGMSYRGMYINQDGAAPDYRATFNGIENAYRWSKCGEIDCVESWGSNYKSNPQCNLWNDVGASISSAAFPTALDVVNEWHVYAIEKTPTYIAAFIDGIEYKRWTYSDYDSNVVEAYVDKAIFILIGIGLGGDAGNSDVTVSGVNRAELYVDWVRVYAPEGITSEILPESVYIQDNIEIPVGYRTYLNPIVLPLTATDMSVTLSSDNPSIARCESGCYLYAESVGETDIYAITKNNIRKKCHVTVTSS